MEAAAVDAVVDGLKKSGVDFISLMPDSDFSVLQDRVARDIDFTYVPVSNEAIGVAVCATFGSAFDRMGLGALVGIVVGVIIAFVLARIAANSL